MRYLFFILISLSYYNNITAQYYYRGELLDEKNKLVTNANIYIHSSRILVNAGSSGTFGIMTTKKQVDTFTFSSDIYEKITVPVFRDKYNTIKLKLLASVANSRRNKLTTSVKDLVTDVQRITLVSSESYASLIENEFITAQQYPITGFAINSDKASYPNVRRFINGSSPVPKQAVRIDEMINYFNLAPTHPNDSSTFYVSSQFTQCPWNTNNLLMFLNVTARKLDLKAIPPSNLVFLIDNSGSMELQNRMEILRTSFKALVQNLREVDKVTVITYGGGVDVLAEGLSGKEKDSLIKIINKMEAGGETPGESALVTAYQKAKQYYIHQGNNRIILASDGDFNVGVADEAELERLIVRHSEAGVYLTCLGLGVGNYKDSKLEVIAKKGKGNFAYLDSEAEAEVVLVKELTQTLFSVADNVFMNMEFNPAYVKEYRLIGYDNKANAVLDSSSKLEGGQVGSGYSTIIMFEIKPTTQPIVDNPNYYLEKKFGTFEIQYLNPITKEVTELNSDCSYNFKPLLSLPGSYGVASSLAMFGGYLKSSKYVSNISMFQIMSLANKVIDKNNGMQNEYVQILDKAENIYEPNAKKKRKKLVKKEQKKESTIIKQ